MEKFFPHWVYNLICLREFSAPPDGKGNAIKNQYPSIQIRDSKRYDLDTFTLCELSGSVLITHPVYADIHSNLVTIPLETDRTLPYGLVYAKDPTAAIRKFINAIHATNPHINCRMQDLR